MFTRCLGLVGLAGTLLQASTVSASPVLPKTSLQSTTATSTQDWTPAPTPFFEPPSGSEFSGQKRFWTAWPSKSRGWDPLTEDDKYKYISLTRPPPRPLIQTSDKSFILTLPNFHSVLITQARQRMPGLGNDANFDPITTQKPSGAYKTNQKLFAAEDKTGGPFRKGPKSGEPDIPTFTAGMVGGSWMLTIPTFATSASLILERYGHMPSGVATMYQYKYVPDIHAATAVPKPIKSLDPRRAPTKSRKASSSPIATASRIMTYDVIHIPSEFLSSAKGIPVATWKKPTANKKPTATSTSSASSTATTTASPSVKPTGIFPFPTLPDKAPAISSSLSKIEVEQSKSLSITSSPSPSTTTTTTESTTTTKIMTTTVTGLPNGGDPLKSFSSLLTSALSSPSPWTQGVPVISDALSSFTSLFNHHPTMHTIVTIQPSTWVHTSVVHSLTTLTTMQTVTAIVPIQTHLIPLPMIPSPLASILSAAAEHASSYGIHAGHSQAQQTAVPSPVGKLVSEATATAQSIQQRAPTSAVPSANLPIGSSLGKGSIGTEVLGKTEVFGKTAVDKVLPMWGIPKPESIKMRNTMVRHLNLAWNDFLESLTLFPAEGNLLANVAGDMLIRTQRLGASIPKLSKLGLSTRQTEVEGQYRFFKDITDRWITCATIWRPDILNEIPKTKIEVANQIYMPILNPSDKKYQRQMVTGEELKKREQSFEICIKDRLPFLTEDTKVGGGYRGRKKAVDLMGTRWKRASTLS
jgi:hypothetical protein